MVADATVYSNDAADGAERKTNAWSSDWLRNVKYAIRRTSKFMLRLVHKDVWAEIINGTPPGVFSLIIIIIIISIDEILHKMI